MLRCRANTKESAENLIAQLLPNGIDKIFHFARFLYKYAYLVTHKDCNAFRIYAAIINIILYTDIYSPIIKIHAFYEFGNLYR